MPILTSDPINDQPTDPQSQQSAPVTDMQSAQPSSGGILTNASTPAQRVQAVSQPNQPSADQANANHPLVRHASILHDIATTLAGGPRFQSTIDPNTGKRTLTPVKLDRKDIGMAIALSAISGALSGLQAKGPNATAQAAGLGFNAVANQRAQADKQVDQKTQEDYENQANAMIRKAQLADHNAHLMQLTAALGHDDESNLQKHVDAFADQRDEQGDPAIRDISEGELRTKYAGQAGKLGEMATTYLALPSKVVPRLDADGKQTIGPDGKPQFELLWNLYDQVRQQPLSQDFMNKAASYGVPGSINSDGKAYQVPVDATISAPAYAKMVRTMESIDLLQNDVNALAEATKTQPTDVKALVKAGKLSPSAINQYFRDHGAATNPAEAVALMKQDPKANAYAPSIVAAFGPDAFTKYANAQAQQKAANAELGKESTPGGQAKIAETKASTREKNAQAEKAANSANPQDVDTLAEQLLQPNNLTAMKDIGGRGNQRTEILAAAARKAKERGIPFDIGLVNQRIKFLGEYEDPKGRAATNRQAINNVLQHAGDLADLNEANRRSNVKIVNTPINKMKDQFGDQTYTQYQTASGVLRDELALYFAGGYAPSKEQQGMWDKIQSDNATPAQTEAFAKEVVRLAARRANTFNQQFRTNMGYDDPNMITPAAKAAAEHLGMGNEVAQFGSGGTLGQRQPQSQPTQRVVPAGAQPILRNGQTVGYILNGQRTNF